MQNAVPLRVQLGSFELDMKAGELRKNSLKVRLQEQPFQILLMLIEGSGQVVTLDEIKKKLWPNDTVVEFDHSIHTAIKKLRQALDDSADNPRYVETVARRGYRLIVPVECLESAPADKPAGEVGSSSSDGAAAKLQLAPAGLIGRIVSHYRVLDVIGGGGMGVVYKAEDLKLGRAVALKFLPEELGSDPHALERFSREARAVSSLDHPNICAIYEFGEHEGRPFMVMQLLEGQTLRDRLADTEGERARPLDELLEIGIQVSDGLQAAHEKGIIHRDIKPANIFLTRKGVAKILDFGLAKLATAIADIEGTVGENAVGHPGGVPSHGMPPSRDQTLTRAGAAMGTAGYMSPEQVRGDKLDVRTDLFSFGLVLYEMFAGLRAFSGDTEPVLKDAILNETPVPIRAHNSAVSPELEKVIDKALQKDRELRYQSAAEMRGDLLTLNRQARLVVSKPPLRRWRFLIAAAVVLVTGVLAGYSWRRWRAGPKLTASDTVVLADFTNHTSGPVFDTALKPALEVELGQTPFLNVLSSEKVNGTLKLMNHREDDKLTPQLAQDVCLHTNSRATLAGSISDAGNQYRIEIKAVDCKTAAKLAEVVTEAGERNQIVKKLGEAGHSLREKLGEPASSLRQFNTPLDAAVSSSVEALQAYAAGFASYGKPDALSHFKRATELDPGFALAYEWLAGCYNNLLQDDRELENLTKAYQLRERLSLRDRLDIEAYYYSNATGEWDKAISVSEQAIRDFPRWGNPRNTLGFLLKSLGQYERAVAVETEALRVTSDIMSPYSNLAWSYISLDRLEDARLVLEQEKARVPDVWNIHWMLYRLAFLQKNQAGMQEQLRWAVGKTAVEDFLLREQSETEAYYGRLDKARELSKRAVESAIRAEAPGRAAEWKANEALRAAKVGEPTRARELTERAQSMSPNLWALLKAALAVAAAGDFAHATELTQQLDHKYPLNTLIQRCELPTIRAQMFLQKHNPDRAIELLQQAAPYELRYAEQFGLEPAYVRGEAYLKAGQGQQAASEFRKLIEHPGIVGNSINGPLTRLQLARAQAMMGDKAAARKSYQDFLTLWKDADLDIPIYKQAKAEYAELK